MKGKRIKLIASFLLVIGASCNEPETVVTNIVHPDGSVLRRIEMKSISDKVEDRFQTSDIQVPFDSTWTVRDSCESSDEVDSIWVRRAEKLFANVEEINKLYRTDSGANKSSSRRVAFEKRFRWFNTGYRFSELVDKQMAYGYPVSDFLDSEELLFFYSPENMQDALTDGSDSLKYRSISDSVGVEVEKWSMKNLVSGWIWEFSDLIKEKDGGIGVKDKLESSESDLYDYLLKNEDDLDSLWTNGIILNKFIGESSYHKFKTEADSAIEMVSNQIWTDFKEYSVKIVMPGTVTGTNGFIDSSGILLWPVKSDYFLTETYEMWAESKVPNRWAWIVSGLFLAFVLTGVVIRVRKKG